MTESRRLWLDCSYVDSNTLVVDGDQVELFEDGRAVRVEIDGAGYEETWVDSTSYVPESDQTEVTLMDGVLTSGLQRCWVSSLKVSAMPHPDAYITKSTYVHTQGTAAETWNIQHDLGRYPSVTLVDNNGETVFGGPPIYEDEDNIRIEFDDAFSGKALLN